MERKAGTVKRRYDSSRRRQQAQRTRSEVLDTATDVLLGEGYTATTVERVAREAGVSVETVYKAFGNKAGLVRAVVERALEGAGPVPAETRSDALQVSAQDPRVVLRGWGALTAEVAPRVAPILLALRSGAADNPELAELQERLITDRYRRMKQNARRLTDGGHLRADITTTTAADVLWAYTSPDLYDLLVQRRRWSPQRYGTFIEHALAAHLLPTPGPVPTV